MRQSCLGHVEREMGLHTCLGLIPCLYLKRSPCSQKGCLTVKTNRYLSQEACVKGMERAQYLDRVVVIQQSVDSGRMSMRINPGRKAVRALR